MDRRLAGKKTTKKWRFILDNGFLSLFLSASQTVCLLFFFFFCPAHKHTHLVFHKHFQGSWQSVQSFPSAGLQMAL